MPAIKRRFIFISAVLSLLSSGIGVAGARIAATPAAAAPLRVDLTRGTVDGWMLLGRTPANVAAIMGSPTHQVGDCVRQRRCDETFRVAGTTFSVKFVLRRGRTLSGTVILADGGTRDVRLGRFLTSGIRLIPHELARVAPGAFVEWQPYTCDTYNCTGVLDRVGGRWHLSYGTSGAHPFVTFWDWS